MTHALLPTDGQLTLVEEILGRAALYNVLAAVFGDPPTPELVIAVEKMLPDLIPVVLADLRQAYTRLLVGPGKGYAPPYASIYLDPSANGKLQLWGPAATVVEALYRAAGLEIAPGQPRVPDHLAHELQFMQHLCAREADAVGRGVTAEAAEWRDRQRVFLRDHLWPWAPRFADRLSDPAVAAHPVYRALAQVVADFVCSDLDVLEHGAEPGSPGAPLV